MWREGKKRARFCPVCRTEIRGKVPGGEKHVAAPVSKTASSTVKAGTMPKVKAGSQAR